MTSPEDKIPAKIVAKINDKDSLHSLLKALPLMVVATDESGIFIEWNHECERVTGFSASEIINNSDPSSLLYPNHEYFLSLKNFWNMQKGTYLNQVWKIHCKDGSERSISWSNISKDYPIEGWYSWGIGLDITELKDVSEKLDQTENQFRSVYNSSETGITLCNLRGELTDVNYACANMLGYRPEEMIGKVFTYFTHPDDVESEIEKLTKHFQSGLTAGFQIKKRYIHKDGSNVWVRLNASLIKDKSGESAIGLCIIQNITDEYKMQEELDDHKEYILSVTKVSEILLTEPNFDLAIEKSFQILGDTAYTDRIYIFENDYDSENEQWLMSQTYEWSKGGITKQIDNPELKNLPYNIANPRWKDVMLAKGTINGLIKDFPEEEKDYLVPQGILSLISVPIYLQDEWWGFIGFDNCTSERVYTKAEESMLQSAAIAIGGAIQRERINRQLIEAKFRAEEMSRLKSIFLANMSHELRTPLIGVLGFSEILSEEIEDPYHKKMIDNIYNAGQRLSSSLNLILDISRIEADKLTLNLESVDIKEILEESITYLKNEAIKKDLYINLNLPDELHILKSDKRMMLTIMDNLISNAIKFTHKGGVDIAVTIEKDSDESFMNIIVKDTGIGIPKDQQKIIFEEFRQVSEGYGRSFEGVGLGLTIIKKFTEKLGGKLSLISQFGKGSTFTITFPTSSVSVKPYTIEEVNLDEKSVYQKTVKRILLIDDDSPTHTLIKIFLRNIAHLDIALNGDEGIKIASKRKFDLILLDINLGNSPSGISVMKKMRNLEEFQNMPIIACTAYSMSGDKEKFLQEGFNEFISKPIIKADFLRTINRFL
jgi:PAS domain S-box-containing protein